MLPFPTPQVAGGRVRFSTWDPANKGATLTLSNGNLTATSSASSLLTSVRATTSLNSGVRVVRHTYNTATTIFPGFVNASFSIISTSTQVGADANSVCFNTTTGNITYNGATVASAGVTAAPGDLIDLALDMVNKSIWVRVNGGNWNNSGTANPATNTGGISVSGMSGPFFPAVTLPTQNNKTDTVQFYGVGFASGILMWDE